jgi:gamma-glutamyl-gamma-aminobutyrate hydrolase PuuD
MSTFQSVYYYGQNGSEEMNYKAEIDSGSHAYAIYKIKRLAKILGVCAGIVVVSVSLGMISALEWASYAISHHKDPAAAGTFSFVLTLILMIGGIAGFMIAVWRVEGKARREVTAK